MDRGLKIGETGERVILLLAIFVMVSFDSNEGRAKTVWKMDYERCINYNKYLTMEIVCSVDQSTISYYINSVSLQS